MNPLAPYKLFLSQQKNAISSLINKLNSFQQSQQLQANSQDAINDLKQTYSNPVLETICYITPVVNVIYHLAKFNFHHQILVRGYKRDLPNSLFHPYLKKLKGKVDSMTGGGLLAALINALAGYAFKRMGYLTVGHYVSLSSAFLFFAVVTGSLTKNGTIKEIEKTEGKIF